MHSRTLKLTYFKAMLVMSCMFCSLASSSKASASEADFRIGVVRTLEQSEALIEIQSVASLDSALVLLDSIISLIGDRFGEEDTLLARAYYNISECRLSQGDYDRSAATVSKAIEIWRAAPAEMPVQMLKGFNILVECGLNKHDLVACEQASERRFEVLGGLPKPLSTAEAEQMVEALNDHARLKVLQNCYDEGMREFQKALGLITEEMEEGPRLRAALTGNIGWLLTWKAEYAEAEKYTKKALELIRIAYHPKHPLVLTAFVFLSNLARLQGDFAQASLLADSALSVAQETREASHPSFSSVYQAKARSLVALDSFDMAIDFAERALAINRRASHYPTDRFMRSLETCGNVALAAGELDLAARRFGELATTRHEFLKTVFGYASESQKLAYLSKYPLLIPSLLSCAVANPEPSTRRVALEIILNGKGLAIDAMAAEKVTASCSSDQTLDSLQNLHRTTCSQIASLALANSDDAEGTLRKMADLYSVKNRLETDLSLLCSNLDFNPDTGLVSVSAVVSKLQEYSVLWEFLKYQRINLDRLYERNSAQGQHYMAVILGSTHDTHFVDLGRASPIDSLIEEYHAIMSDALLEQFTGEVSSSQARLAEVSIDLYSHLLAPLENTLANVHTIYVAADGALNQLPLETLTKDGRRYLIEDYQFSYLTSGRDLLEERHDANTGDAIVMADPDYMIDPATFPIFTTEYTSAFASRGNTQAPECLASMFSPLPMTRQEGAAVVQLLDQAGTMDISYLEAGNAREGALKSLQHAPRVLHIATHGYFCPESDLNTLSNPLLRSGLLLAGANRTIGQMSDDRDGYEDGILTALEASGLNLVGTDLVVLSACQTAVGEVRSGEGVFGLRRAFQHAGAQSLIMSMFAVPDASTASLMQRFYSNWLSGQSKSEALHSASLSILNERREQGASPSPPFWGGFALVGDPN